MENSFAEGYAVGRDTNNNNGWGFGNNGDWLWIIVLFALFNGGWGNGFGGGFGGSNMNYEIGRLATTNDVASGFNNSAVLSSLNDIKLGQQQAINYNNQGFAGLNSVINSGFASVNNAICTLGYQNAQLVNGLSRELADCCCTTQRAIDGINYNMAKNTCDIIQSNNANTQRVIDFLTSEKIASLQAENSGLKAQISNDRQSAYIIDALAPKCPQPAYVVQPPQQVTFPTNCCGNVAYANYNNGCGCNFN